MNKKCIFKIFFIFIICISISPKIFADDFLEDSISNDDLSEIQTSSDVSNIPKINARHAVIYDRASSTILYGKSENEQCKMASTTKIMTAIVVLEKVQNLDELVTISKKAAGTGGSRLGLSTNDKITVENLLYGLMMRSGNDAAVALAEYVGGSIENFSILMNDKALSLSLENTHFVTPHGLDNDDHYTTAYELAKLTDYALLNKTFAKIVNTQSHTIYINNSPQTLSNTNELLGNLNGVYGVKTGFTNGANRCLVTSCKRGNLDIICVVLGCDTKKDRTKDSINLINYIFDNYTMVNVENIILKDFNNWKINHLNSFTINKGINSNIDLELNISEIPYSNIAINKNNVDTISTSITFNPYFEAPLPYNTILGKLVLKISDTKYFEINILNKNEIKKKNFFDYWFYFIINYFNIQNTNLSNNTYS